MEYLCTFCSVFAKVLGSYARQSLCVNLPSHFTEQDELASAQEPAKKFNTGSNKALTSLEAPIPVLVSPFNKNFFIKFMKAFVESIQFQDEAQECFLKARIPKIYWSKSYRKCYHFCYWCEDYFQTSGATGINCTPFTILFLRSIITLR